jgi:hypothetical protein
LEPAYTLPISGSSADHRFWLAFRPRNAGLPPDVALAGAAVIDDPV